MSHPRELNDPNRKPGSKDSPSIGFFGKQVLYLALGASLGYSSQTLPFNLAPADGFILVLLFLYAISATHESVRSIQPQIFFCGVWLIAIGQLIGAGASFGVEDMAAVVKDCLPPLVAVTIVVLVARRPDRAIAIVVGAGAAVTASAALSSTDRIRLRGGLGNPNLTGHFAASVIVTALVLTACFWSQISSVTRISVLLITVPSSVIIIFRTGSFGALALLVGSLAYVLWSKTTASDPLLKISVRIAGIAVIYVAATRGAIPLRLETVDLGSGLSASRFERSSTGRLELWSDGLGFLADHPLGGGPRPSIRADWPSGPGEFHQDLLDMGASGGWIALAGLAAIAFGLWRLGGAGGPLRVLLAGLAMSALTRQTWNFRHAWVMIGVAIAAEAFREHRSRGGNAVGHRPGALRRNVPASVVRITS